jgi:exodeoxyribonuclease-5
MTDKALMKADQVLVGMRNTRDAINRRVRIVNGRFDIDSQFPVKGDRLMCLKNNKQNGLMNGTIWQCTQPQIKVIRKLKDFRNPKSGFEDTNIEGLHFKVRSYDMFDADGRPLIVNTVCSTHHFDTNLPEPNWRDIAGTDQWGFAYACTVHKAQGSQWDHVLVVDQSDVFQDQIQEHLYTAITRAAKSVKVFL